MSAIEPFALTETISRICPDIYHPAIARDGLLTRLRIPGGVLNELQCRMIAELLETIGLEYVQVTNRANLQLRSLSQDLDRDLLTKLTECGLAASNTAVDGIRNIMLSPTAGIDAQELIDVRPLAAAWLEYLDLHPELGSLSNKFSVGFDGGGSVGILDRPNDITLLAIGKDEFSLHLGMGNRGEAPQPVGVNLTTDECLPMLAAIAQSYLQGITVIGGDTRRKPRLRDVISDDGLAEFGELVRREFIGSRQFVFKNTSLDSAKRTLRERDYIQVNNDLHLGAQQQRQPDRYYVGVVLLLGRWTVAQIKGLESIAVQYGSGTIRLTPWQNVIIPDVRSIDLNTVQGLINDLGLVQTATHPSSLLRACAGATGCQFSATDTQADAIALSEYLAAQFTLDRPLNIHFSGCEKSCAQPDLADITLWGEAETSERGSRYRLEIGEVRATFEQESRDLLPPERIPIFVGKLIEDYQQRRLDAQESLPAFINRQ
ncbi:precorrin-3B synthase [Chamaesiphon sp. OTE_75_metabat_556]|uniref:precorrin-3B synthase n=1 Tax=Chamaesiphon sp. OTE_75_metabat_556 TaxID=2964692 RepID=UPI00286B075E|nr:precorrin-3B synthase [Chamaesiphon sp. OTE_75_metabat_556]